MPSEVKSLSRFLSQMYEESEDLPITWLIGSGMSASSGIPLASGITERIVLFKYLSSEKWRSENPIARPWDLEDQSQLKITSSEVKRFLTWFKESHDKDDFYYRTVKEEATSWLELQDCFQTVGLTDPECYQLVFGKLIQSDATRQLLIRAFVNESIGVNLAHLGLAGFLRDHPERGHTVFTTNFDDLLLQALLYIGSTATVIGEHEFEDQESKARSSLNPPYPQIIHLHGRHTGYRLANTTDQISLINEPLKAVFKNHIAESHLLVLGYSGWDDLVMTTLAEWPTNHRVLRGNLIWVPYRDASTISNKVREFLDRCPPNRVTIIDDQQAMLNADAFILALSDKFGPKGRGISGFRSEIVSHAQAHHAFILEQLKRFPQFDPERALTMSIEAREAVVKGGQDNLVTDKLDQAVLISSNTDLPQEFLGRLHLHLAENFLLIREFLKAKTHLEYARIFIDNTKSDSAEGRLRKALAQFATALYYVSIGSYGDALGRFAMANSRFERPNATDVVKNRGNSKVPQVAYSKLCSCEMELSRGRLVNARAYLNNAVDLFQQNGHSYGIAHCERLKGELHLSMDELHEAGIAFKVAKQKFEMVGEHVRASSMLLRLSFLELLLKNFSEAKTLLEEAERALMRFPNLMVCEANLDLAWGDFNYHQDRFDEALECYARSRKKFTALSSRRGILNAVKECLKVSKDIGDDEMVKALEVECKTLSKEVFGIL